MSQEELLTLTEAAKYAHVTRQAIYKALRERGLKAQKIDNRWLLRKGDIDEYRGNKYNRDMRMVNGQLIFDMVKGEFSVMQVCKVISATLGRPFPPQRLYYLLRSGQIKSFKKGSAWIIKKEDAVALLQEELDKNNLQIKEN
jgi:excisionase family DNA binding protein